MWMSDGTHVVAYCMFTSVCSLVPSLLPLTDMVRTLTSVERVRLATLHSKASALSTHPHTHCSSLEPWARSPPPSSLSCVRTTSSVGARRSLVLPHMACLAGVTVGPVAVVGEATTGVAVEVAMVTTGMVALVPAKLVAGARAVTVLSRRSMAAHKAGMFAWRAVLLLSVA